MVQGDDISSKTQKPLTENTSQLKYLLDGQRMMYGDGPSQNTPFVNIQKVIRSAMLRSGT